MGGEWAGEIRQTADKLSRWVKSSTGRSVFLKRRSLYEPKGWIYGWIKEKGLQEISCNPLILLVRPEGFEPPTPGFEGRCSIQLSYRRIVSDHRVRHLLCYRPVRILFVWLSDLCLASAAPCDRLQLGHTNTMFTKKPAYQPAILRGLESTCQARSVISSISARVTESGSQR